MPGHNHYSNCSCGWCSGGWRGGWRSSFRGDFDSPPGGSSGGISNPYTVVEKSCDDTECCYPTKCSICGASVFFVRHNGGSVWFDHLGKPWPKHSCFSDSPNSHLFRHRLLELSDFRTVRFGVAVRIVSERIDGGVLEICYPNRQRISYRIIHSNMLDLIELLGQLIILTEKDAVLRICCGPELIERATVAGIVEEISE